MGTWVVRLARQELNFLSHLSSPLSTFYVKTVPSQAAQASLELAKFLSHFPEALCCQARSPALALLPLSFLTHAVTASSLLSEFVIQAAGGASQPSTQTEANRRQSHTVWPHLKCGAAEQHSPFPNGKIPHQALTPHE